MYRTRKVEISKKHDLYDWCCTITSNANNLYNAALFRVRQVISSLPKEDEQLTENEKRVLFEIEDALPYMKHAEDKPKIGKSRVSYYFLNELMYVTRNPDYFAPGLPRQTAQQTLRNVIRDTDSYFKALKEYSSTPERFSGTPRLPSYHQKDGRCTSIITNQDCKIVLREDQKFYAKLPLTKTTLCLGKGVQGELKQVTIKPMEERFLLSFIFYDSSSVEVPQNSVRICAIDPGVDNIAAITNNVGLPCLLYKGSAIKAANQLYNKKLGQFSFSEKLSKEDQSKIQLLLQTRNHVIDDQLLKTCKSIIQWCREHDIDTIVMGSAASREFILQTRDHGKQSFVPIPFTRMRNILSYQAERNGIRFIIQDESYTSKASFLDEDKIDPKTPQTNPIFSGGRLSEHDKTGSRGMYQAKDGTVINADLNASANILRKAFPNAFSDGIMPDFQNVIVIHHPDATATKKNRETQQKRNLSISKSKQKRLKQKM